MYAFAVDTLITIFVTYATGTALLRLLRLPWVWSIVAAPAASLCVYAIMGEALCAKGIPATTQNVFWIPLCVLALLALIMRFLHPKEVELPQVSWSHFALYAGFGLAIGAIVFLQALPSADAIFQSEDLSKHALQIQAFVDSHKFSSLHASIYQDISDIAPINDVEFYPCAWHTLCSLVVMLGGRSVPLAINASQYVFACLVYPLSMLALLSTLFKDRRELLPIGALGCMCIVAYPWTFLVFGPLFPNLCGLACLPAVEALFIYAAAPDTFKSQGVLGRILGLLACGIGLTLTHPNTIFTGAVLLIPYLCWVASTVDVSLFSHPTTSSQRFFATAFFFALIWTILRFSPPLIGVCSYNWPAIVNPWQAFFNVTSLAYAHGFLDLRLMAQPVVAAALIMGCIKLTRDRSLWWLPVSYAFAYLICFVCISTEGALKHLMGGFWYTDPCRLAATAAIVAAPLETVGLYQMAQWLLAKFQQKLKERQVSAYPKQVLSCLVAGVLLVATFLPSFSIPGVMSYKGAFSAFRSDVKEKYNLNAPLNEEERAFAKEAKSIVGDDLVINYSLDGSLLSYGVDDLHCYYRSRWGYDPRNETAESYIIRKRLCEIATNPTVKQAVKKIGARYVIRLDVGTPEDSFLQWYWRPEFFRGIEAINPSTPGFELILREGNLQLYRILD